MGDGQGRHWLSRRRPARGVTVSAGAPTIVCLTVCTRDRSPWLACAEAHDLLVECWQAATAWVVGRYVLMPDHLHLFATPADDDVALDRWVTYWKSRFSKHHGRPEQRWQAGFWDRRLRNIASYASKLEYVQNNPVRAGLVARAGEWPWSGELHELRW